MARCSSWRLRHSRVMPGRRQRSTASARRCSHLPDGQAPTVGLIYAAGSLNGSTGRGGLNNSGTVFALVSPAKPAGLWTETVLYSLFSAGRCYDGATPTGGLIQDAAGNLYGTAGDGSGGAGIVFEVVGGVYKAYPALAEQVEYSWRESRPTSQCRGLPTEFFTAWTARATKGETLWREHQHTETSRCRAITTRWQNGLCGLAAVGWQMVHHSEP